VLRRLTILVALATALAAWAPARAALAQEAAGGADNVVNVTNMQDGGKAARGQVAVAHDAAPTVGNQNLAIARATCTDCRTVAVAMQAVVVEAQPTDFEPHNAAVAANSGCTNCQTLAYAFQYVTQPGVPVHLSQEGQEGLRDIQEQVDDAASSDLPLGVVVAELDGAAGQLVNVINTELVRSGRAGEGSPMRDVQSDVS